MVKKYLIIEHNEDIAPATTKLFDTEKDRRDYFLNELQRAYYKDAIDCLIAKHKFDPNAPVDEKTFDFMRVHVSSVEEFVDTINPTKDPKRTFKLTDIKTVERHIKIQAFADSLQAYLEMQQSNYYYNTTIDVIYTFVDLEV